MRICGVKGAVRNSEAKVVALGEVPEVAKAHTHRGGMLIWTTWTSSMLRPEWQCQ